MIKKSYVSIFSLLLLATSAFANPTEVILQLNWKAEPQFGGFYAASLAGADAAQNIKLKNQMGGSGTPTVQMLRNQKVDFAIVSADELLISNDKNPNKPLVAVFAVFQKNPQIIMCREENKFDSLKDLFASNVRLAWQAGLPYALFLKQKYPKTKVQSVPNTGGLPIYTQKKDHRICLQGFVTSEPFLATKAGVASQVFLIAEEGFNPYTTVLAVRKDTLEKNEDLVKRVVLAAREGWASYLRNPTPTNAELNRLNPSMDLRSMKESAEAQVPLIRTSTDAQIGTMTNERWSQLIQQMKEIKLIKKTLSSETQFKNF